MYPEIEGAVPWCASWAAGDQSRVVTDNIVPWWPHSLMHHCAPKSRPDLHDWTHVTAQRKECDGLLFPSAFPTENLMSCKQRSTQEATYSCSHGDMPRNCQNQFSAFVCGGTKTNTQRCQIEHAPARAISLTALRILLFPQPLKSFPFSILHVSPSLNFLPVFIFTTAVHLARTPHDLVRPSFPTRHVGEYMCRQTLKNARKRRCKRFPSTLTCILTRLVPDFLSACANPQRRRDGGQSGSY